MLKSFGQVVSIRQLNLVRFHILYQWKLRLVHCILKLNFIIQATIQGLMNLN